jgi:hypothetical protein
MDKPSTWLVGSWQSDRARTIAAWGDFAPGSPSFQASILRDLGKLVITYGKSQSTTDFNGTRTVSSYKVVWQSTDSAFVVTGEADEESGKQIHFQSPEVCWVHTGRFVEYFCKIKNA